MMMLSPTLPLSPSPILRNEHGYADNRYDDKPEQMLKVCDYIENQGFIPKDLVRNEVAWFYGNLGIDDMYFMMESVEVIARHIMALYAAKIISYIKNDTPLDVNLEREGEDYAVYIHPSKPGISNHTGPQYEKRIDSKYLDISNRERAYRLETYRSLGTVSSSMKTQLRCYFVTKCQFINPDADQNESDIRKVSDKMFLSKATENTLDLYQKAMTSVLQTNGPVIQLFDIEGTRQKRLIIAYRQQSTQFFFSALSDLYHYYELYSTRKYVEQFSNGVTIMSLYLSQITDSQSPPIEHSILQIVKEASLIFCLPTTPLQSFFQTSKLSVQESVYGYAGLIFAQHFLNRLGSEYATLSSVLNLTDPIHVEVLSKIKKRLRQDTFTREYVTDIVRSYPNLIKQLYINFAMSHYMTARENSLKPSLSFQRLQVERALTEQELLDLVKKTVSNNHELMVFESYITFNKHILKTNFYQPTKVALSFRLDPSFLPELEYPIRPFGLFIVIGSEFRGFHIRFRDIARGGIRIIKSRNREAYSINLRSLFDEAYSLALTQQRKNKDIPEGGSKGTILLDAQQQDKAHVSFQKYVDSILDLLVRVPGERDRFVDKYGKPEILFFGPDEGTADYMDWASQHAKKRGASFWKAFTTGKSQSLGGIPHDLFGMTTRSVHQYVLGIYRKLGLKEDACKKLQTGGPDGDLGSNEIKISRDKTIGVVDGSGVLFDPEGIDRTELLELANKRQMISHFDVTKLSSHGFRVLIDDHDIVLPNGQLVEDGLKFRNEFHLNPCSSADVFVPCGGRPEAVDINNVNMLLNEDETPRFKYIVEGANLFFTQEARIRLEQAGAIIFKDASANKGGVTSSSLEVLAALAFSDEEFAEHMEVKQGGIVPPFYQDYIKTVHNVIEKNAELEFECIWREHKKTGTPRSIISDESSYAIVKLNEELQQTPLWENIPLRRRVLQDALPKILLDKLGLDKLLERIPTNYISAIFGSHLASRFVYQYGVNPSQFAFFEFMSRYFERL